MSTSHAYVGRTIKVASDFHNDPFSNLRRPRVLFLCSGIPFPPTKGIRIRQMAQIETLSQSFDLRVVIGNGVPKELLEVFTSAIGVEVDCWRHIPVPEEPTPWRRLLSLSPYYALHPKARNYHRLDYLMTLASKPWNLVWVSRLETAWRIGAIEGIPTVLDADEIESTTYEARSYLRSNQNLLERAAHRLDIARLTRTEQGLWKQYNIVAFASEDEVKRSQLLCARLLPNCPPTKTATESEAQKQGNNILFIGTLEYQPNLHGLQWFLASVWPRLRAAWPRVTLHVVGEGGRSRLAPDILGVRIHDLLDDPNPIWADCVLSVVPAFAGGGTRIKILDAWQRRVPVVSTTAAAAGLEATAGKHLLIADAADEFVAACDQLLRTPSLGTATAASAAHLLHTRYSRKAAADAVLAIASEALRFNSSRVVTV